MGPDAAEHAAAPGITAIIGTTTPNHVGTRTVIQVTAE
jgi:hypothetical protein